MKSFSVQVVETAALALLLCSLAAGQVSQCAATGSPKLRFVAQLNVNGCALFVHDTGASDGPHLAVEPVMCVTDRLERLLLRLDPVTQQLYVSVPVVLRDANMLEEVQRQLRHLSPRSVSFAAVRDISVSFDPNSSIVGVGLLWSPGEPIATLRLGFKERPGSDSTTNRASYDTWLQGFSSMRFLQSIEPHVVFSSNISSNPRLALSRVRLSASIVANGDCHSFSYNVLQKNDIFFEPELYRRRYNISSCRPLRFVRSINLESCTARVHQRLDIKGHLLIEPLLCHNISSLSSESVMYDYSRSMYYLKLDVVLEDEVTLEAVKSQLADLFPRSVTFMKLWSAESIVSSALSSRFSIGPLRLSADWRSAQLLVHCQTLEQCRGLRSSLESEPADFWRHTKWRATFLLPDNCSVESSVELLPWRMKPSTRAVSCSSLKQCLKLCCTTNCGPISETEALLVRRDGRCFVKIQQRLTGTVSFQRNWAEYETGFGDNSDFWTGLSTIHSLSAGGTTLRVEMKLWDGTELHAEYAGFQVGDASTKYEMTYREMLRSNVGYDAMATHKDIRFSTMDSDNDKNSSGSCSNAWGKAGWWFNRCHQFGPNGLFPSRETLDKRKTSDWTYMVWYTNSELLSLRSVRLLLEL